MRGLNVVSLSSALDETRRLAAKDVRRRLFEKCRANAEEAGDRIAGFAVVVWDSDGNLWSSYDARTGPIGPALVPTLAQDALNRHVAVVLAAERVAAES